MKLAIWAVVGLVMGNVLVDIARRKIGDEISEQLTSRLGRTPDIKEASRAAADAFVSSLTDVEILRISISEILN